MASTVACAVAAAAGWTLGAAGLPGPGLAAYLVAYATGGWEASIRAMRALRDRRVDVDLLMLLAAAGAALVDAWAEGAVLLFLFALGNTLETYAFRRTRHSIEGLMRLRPDTASVVRDGEEERVSVESLEPGMVVRVRPGERLAVDGEIVYGRSSLDESTLTGEPVPVGKDVGAEVFAGTLNVEGSLDVRVTRAAGESTLARVVRLVEEAREARDPVQGWIERVEGRYAVAVIAGAGVAAVAPVLFLGWSFGDAFYRAMTLLVVASPCALVISIPATVVSAVANGARNGVLFKGGAALDVLGSVPVVALDKTGTLTVGHPELLGLVRAGGGADGGDPRADDRFLARVAAVEGRSEHPLAAAVLRGAEARGVAVPDADAFTSTPGAGVRARVEGAEVAVGSRAWAEAVAGGPVPDDVEAWLDDRGRRTATPVFVVVDGRHAGAVALADRPRPHVRRTLDALRAAGVRHLVMLTGDDPETARAVADAMGVDEVRASLLPEDKSRAIAEIRERHGPVAMVGDGVNDAPALAAADVGVAVGAVGTDVALETADVVLMGDDLEALVHARALGRRAVRVIRQNLVFAGGVIVVLVGLALFGRIGLPAGVVGHEGSTILVVLNGLRLLPGRRGGGAAACPVPETEAVATVH